MPPFVEVSPSSVIISPFFSGTESLTLDLSNVDVASCSEVTGVIELQCGSLNQNAFDNERIDVIIRDNSGAVCSDPHLSQKVKGSDEVLSPIMTNICYDLYGKAGDQYEIISDSILGKFSFLSTLQYI